MQYIKPLTLNHLMLEVYVVWLTISPTFIVDPLLRASLVAQRLKRLPGMQETWVRSLGWEDPLEKEMATYSSTLAWRIPWREEPGRLQSMGSQGVGHDWVTSLSFLYPSWSPKCLQFLKRLVDWVKEGKKTWDRKYSVNLIINKFSKVINSIGIGFCQADKLKHV